MIFVSLIAITDQIRRYQRARRFITTLPVDAENSLIRKVLNQPDGRKVSLIIYWADNLKLLTYSDRKHLEQTGIVISLTPREVLIEDPASGRKVVVKRMGDVTAPEVPD
jgi:hypothetical protein